ncbi:MAG: hypothetical protein AAFQ42_12635 [Pseudomonadota bacterium]
MIDDRPRLFAYKTAPRFDGLAALDAFDPTPHAADASSIRRAGPRAGQLADTFCPETNA